MGADAENPIYISDDNDDDDDNNHDVPFYTPMEEGDISFDEEEQKISFMFLNQQQ